MSVATVSRTFQYPERVLHETRARVHAAAEKLHYSPNARARSLRTAKSSVVIALIPDITNPFYTDVIQSIEIVAQQHGYSLLLGDTQHDTANERRYGDLISSRVADGMITFLPRAPAIRITGRLPIVNACELIDDPTISSVSVDDYTAFRKATDYMLALGHRSIAFIGGLPGSPLSEARRAGFTDAMAAAKLTVDPKLFAAGSTSPEAGQRGAELILAYGIPVTAFMCLTDQLAIGVLQALHLNKIKVPADVSVLGFDDIAFARFTNPPLTTVAQPRAVIGKESMLMLLQLLKDDTTPARKLIVPTELRIRGSTGPPPTGKKARR